MENQNAIIRYNFDKLKDLKTGMWYAICKWCEKKCIMGASGGFGMAIKHMKSCDKAKGSGELSYLPFLRWKVNMPLYGIILISRRTRGSGCGTQLANGAGKNVAWGFQADMGRQ
ncbi:unnamed protein product [Cuscuta europaea]|uniref:Uncharacterized protein n=1 Tax=Cuscuta europaea TaxID=41803 RepID=A0A9P0ZSX7_CUSEU|nr:unnamed protein product [Cuscuta europaea]